MKKRYIKPMIVFESFSLSASISLGCDQRVGNPSEGSCGIPDENGLDFYFFTDYSTGCNVPQLGDIYDGFCYHVPTEGYELFNS